MSDSPETPWSCRDNAIKNPFDPRYVTKPTFPSPDWLKLQEDELAAQANPEWAPHQDFKEALFDAQLHNPPFHSDPNDPAPYYAYNNAVYANFPVPPPSQHLIAPDATVTQRLINGTSTRYGELVKGRPAPNARPPHALRAIRNGFKREQLARMQCAAVNNTDYNKRKTTWDRIQQHFSQGGKLHCGTPDATWNSEAKYPNGKNAGMEWGDMLLADIASSVPRGNFPRGDDRLLLTACLEYAVDHPELALDTTHWDWIIQNRLQGFEVPPAPRGRNVNRDTVAHERLFA
ncbi:hypothetical protein LTR65_009766 [Meristemomyces frigidus]